MRVLLDDEPCDMTARSIGEAIEAAAALAESRGRVIVDVYVDGSRWTSDQLVAPRESDSLAAEVNIVSADPAALVEYTFSQATEALGDADRLQREAAELIQADDSRQAMNRLGEAITIWLSVQQAVSDGSQIIGLDLDPIVVDGVPVPQTIQRLHEQLQSLRGALAAADSISLSDTLLYELPAVVDEWRAMIEHLRSLVNRKDAR